MSAPKSCQRVSLGVFSALLLVAGAGHAAQPVVLNPEQTRITDQKVHADLSILNKTQDRIAHLNAGGLAADNYYLVKAQAWLDFAMAEYHENDRTGVIDEALFQSQDLVERLETAESNINMDTPVITGSQRLREDLWTIAARLKQHQGFSCAAAPLAELEVRLVWAGHENQELGWRHAREHFAAAERLAKLANNLAEHCICPPAAETPCAAKPAEPVPQVVQPVPVTPKPVEPPPPPEKKDSLLVNVPRNVHFGLDKSDINARAGIILDRVAEILKAYPDMHINLIGHTDSRASRAYNLALSERRARAVLKYLQGKGIAASRMEIRAEGFNQTLKADEELMGYALSRRVEVEYQGQTIESYDQTGDLVVEQARQQAQKRKAQAPRKSPLAKAGAKSRKKR